MQSTDAAMPINKGVPEPAAGLEQGMPSALVRVPPASEAVGPPGRASAPSSAPPFLLG